MLLAAVAGLLVAAAAALLWLTASEGGTRWLLQRVASRTPLVLQGVDGSLWRGLRLHTLVWEDPALGLQLQRVEIVPRWEWRCLRQRRLCLQRATVAALRLRSAGSDDGADAPSGLPEIALPIALIVDELQVDRLQWLTAAQDPADAQAGVVLADIAATLRLRSDGLALQGLRVTHPLLRIDAAALDLAWRGAWPLRAALSLTLTQGPESLPARWQLSASGDLADLHLRLDSAAAPELALRARLQPAADFRALDARLVAAGLPGLPLLQPLQPWLQLTTPLEADATLRAGTGGRPVGSVSVRGTIAGYAPQPLALRGQLELAQDSWELADLSLRDGAGSARLRLAGALGSPGEWALRLGLELAGLALPAEGGLPLSGLRGAAQLHWTAAQPRRWQARDIDLAADWDGRP